MNELDDDLEAVPGALTGDPKAPYGVTASGAVRAKPGRRPGQPNGTGRTTKKAAAAPAAPKKVAPPKASVPPKGKPDYRPGILNLWGQITGAMALTGVARRNDLLVADAATLTTGGPGVAELLNEAADRWTVVAAILDKVLAVGPFAEGGGVVLLMAAQLAVNHGMIPAGIIPGTQSRENVVKSFLAEHFEANPDFKAAVQQVQQPPAASGAYDQTHE